MGRIIKRDQIRKGDKIVIKRTIEVATELDSDGDFKTPEGIWFEFDRDAVDQGMYEIELLHRDTPPLPTRIGSVITVSSSSGSGRWMLADAAHDLPNGSPVPVWVSAANVNYTPLEMVEFLESRQDRTFEVDL